MSGNGCTDIGGFVVDGRGFVKSGWANCGITTVVDVGIVDTGTVDAGAVDVRTIDTGARSAGGRAPISCSSTSIHGVTFCQG